MLKKIYLLIIIFAPLIIGYLHNMVTILILSIHIPIIFDIYWYGSPVLMAYFWFWVGGKFAQRNIKIFASVLLGNFVGIVSIFVYLWQFVLIPDNQRNIFLASTSMYFSSTISIFIPKFAYLFEPDKNHIGMVTLNAVQIMGLLLMIIMFTAGYYYKKNKTKSKDSN